MLKRHLMRFKVRLARKEDDEEVTKEMIKFNEIKKRMSGTFTDFTLESCAFIQ